MTKLRVTLACGDYDRTRPLIEGKVNISGIDLDVTVLSSGERHSRFMRNLEFDVCELQVAQDLGLKTPAPITAIPVFPHTVQRKSLKVDREVVPENVYDLSIVRALNEGWENLGEAG
jgi:hypothetical protein